MTERYIKDTNILNIPIKIEYSRFSTKDENFKFRYVNDNKFFKDPLYFIELSEDRFSFELLYNGTFYNKNTYFNRKSHLETPELLIYFEYKNNAIIVNNEIIVYLSKKCYNELYNAFIELGLLTDNIVYFPYTKGKRIKAF